MSVKLKKMGLVLLAALNTFRAFGTEDSRTIEFDMNALNGREASKVLKIENKSDYAVTVTCGEKNCSYNPFAPYFHGDSHEVNLYPSTLNHRGGAFYDSAQINATGADLLIKSEIFIRPQSHQKPRIIKYITDETMVLQVVGYGATLYFTPIFAKYLLNSNKEFKSLMDSVSDTIGELIDRIDGIDGIDGIDEKDSKKKDNLIDRTFRNALKNSLKPYKNKLPEELFNAIQAFVDNKSINISKFGTSMLKAAVESEALPWVLTTAVSASYAYIVAERAGGLEWISNITGLKTPYAKGLLFSGGLVLSGSAAYALPAWVIPFAANNPVFACVAIKGAATGYAYREYRKHQDKYGDVKWTTLKGVSTRNINNEVAEQLLYIVNKENASTTKFTDMTLDAPIFNRIDVRDEDVDMDDIDEEVGEAS